MFIGSMGNFDGTIFLHALYVTLAYATLAIGATFYRQILDNSDVKEVKLGEDLLYALDPLNVLWVVILCVTFVILVVWALYAVPAVTKYYVIPLAVGVNIVQLSYRMRHQRLQVKTLGCIGRSLFEERFKAIRYNNIHVVDVEESAFWYIVIVYYTEQTSDTDRNKPDEVKEFHRRISRFALDGFLQAIRSGSDAKIFIKKDTSDNDNTEV